jgi:hypothetical protein
MRNWIALLLALLSQALVANDFFGIDPNPFLLSPGHGIISGLPAADSTLGLDTRFALTVGEGSEWHGLNVAIISDHHCIMYRGPSFIPGRCQKLDMLLSDQDERRLIHSLNAAGIGRLAARYVRPDVRDGGQCVISVRCGMTNRVCYMSNLFPTEARATFQVIDDLITSKALTAIITPISDREWMNINQQIWRMVPCQSAFVRNASRPPLEPGRAQPAIGTAWPFVLLGLGLPLWWLLIFFLIDRASALPALRRRYPTVPVLLPPMRSGWARLGAVPAYHSLRLGLADDGLFIEVQFPFILHRAAICMPLADLHGFSEKTLHFRTSVLVTVGDPSVAILQMPAGLLNANDAGRRLRASRLEAGAARAEPRSSPHGPAQ